MKGKYAKEKVKTNSIIKKLIFMAIIVTMLAGDFILPIKLWSVAKEYAEIEKNTTASASSSENANENANSNDSVNNSKESSKNDAENELGKENEESKTAENGENNAKKGSASTVNEEQEKGLASKENLADSGNGESALKGNSNQNATDENAEESKEKEANVEGNSKNQAKAGESKNGSSNDEGSASSIEGNKDENNENEPNLNANNEENSNNNEANVTDAEKGNDENLNNENVNASSENSQTSSAIKRNAPVGLLNTNNSLSLQKGANNAEPEKTLEQLDSEMKATSKDTINERKQNNTYKTKNNLYEIRRFSTQFLSGAKKDGNNNLVWSATTNNSGHEFTFRVNYEISGYKEISAGDFRITIPKQILRNREVAFADSYIMSLPNLAECKEEGYIAELIYKEDGDYLVIYNSKPVDAGLNGYFEISYATNSETYNYKDYNPANTDLVKNGGTASDEFYAILELNVDKEATNEGNGGNTEATEKDILNNVAEGKNVFINTAVRLQSTQKRYPNIYRDWNTAWKEEVPADSADYYYLVWEICSYIDNNITQKYNFTLDDFVTNLQDIKEVHLVEEHIS